MPTQQTTPKMAISIDHLSNDEEAYGLSFCGFPSIQPLVTKLELLWEILLVCPWGLAIVSLAMGLLPVGTAVWEAVDKVMGMDIEMLMEVAIRNPSGWDLGCH